ncbi:MAG: hypothetical protein P4M11_02375 [Candidatus Pacebacteria bacterium]|nr:hypothetical protein [Candidatus Paceibacterota bacterium]
MGIVIQRLSEKRIRGWVPYRDSKLTRYMQSALEGNAKIAIVCTMSPANGCYDESTNTLCFALRARNITQHVQRNEVADNDKALIYSYEQEIRRLQTRLKSMESQQHHTSQAVIPYFSYMLSPP